MTCPKCGGKSKVVNTAKDVDEVVRLRRCTVCEYPFYTAERDIDPIDGYEVISRIRNKEKYKKRGVRK
jgi:transcriptional regulator NrdR family protein